MKREFKLGDRVLVRNNDLEKWRVVIYNKVDKSYLRPFLDINGHVWSQCRHIDDFRAGDKVQVCDDVQVIDEDLNWEDAVYIGLIESANENYPYIATTESSNLNFYKFCRWHPSMPWAEKEEPQKEKPLTLEQRVEALERKMKNQ